MFALTVVQTDRFVCHERRVRSNGRKRLYNRRCSALGPNPTPAPPGALKEPRRRRKDRPRSRPSVPNSAPERPSRPDRLRRSLRALSSWGISAASGSRLEAFLVLLGRFWRHSGILRGRFGWPRQPPSFEKASRRDHGEVRPQTQPND